MIVILRFFQKPPIAVLKGENQMEKITQKKIAELIGAKLRHNFGIDPNEASDEFFYKATVLAVLDIMRERRQEFRDKAKESGEKTVYY